MPKVVLIGYSGHAYVAADIFIKSGYELIGYCDRTEKQINPFGLSYLGPEMEYFAHKPDELFFVAIGDNALRKKIQTQLESLGARAANAIHPSAIIGHGVQISHGVMICANATINPLAQIADGAIINTGAIVEHECVVGAFAHIGPGAVLCGNVHVGDYSFVGAGSVVKQGITIGQSATIGSGASVVKSIPDNVIAIGVPAKF